MHATRSSTGTRFHRSNAAAALSTAVFAISTVAFWNIPITCSGADGFSDLVFSAVYTRSPPMVSGYSRPNAAFTCASASSMALRLAGTEKSMNASFANSPRFIFTAARFVGAFGVPVVAVDVISYASQWIQRASRTIIPLPFYLCVSSRRNRREISELWQEGGGPACPEGQAEAPP